LKPKNHKSKRPLKFGNLRERVKSGELDAKRVLRWLQKREWISPKLLTWLQGFDLEQHRERSAANKKTREEQLSKN
jgi:hypothetical protein